MTPSAIAGHRGRDVGSRHCWSDEDDVVACYLSLHGDAHLPIGRAEIAQHLGMSYGSLRMREGNFKNLRNGGGGLANVAQRSRRVFEALAGHGEQMLRDRVLASLRSR